MPILSEPKVSVIIPTWNRAYCLENAINSALNQTFSVFEILVCDDGSDDGSEQLVEGINDERVRWVSGTRGGCPAIPRNRGILESKGDWVAFLDSDDEWLPNKLELQLEATMQRKIDVVCSNAIRLNKNRSQLGLLINREKELITFSDVIKNNEVICSSILIKKSILTTIGGFPEDTMLRVGEDCSLWLRALTMSNFIFIKKPLLLYSDDPSGSIRAFSPGQFRLKILIIQDFISWVSSCGQLKTYYYLIVIINSLFKHLVNNIYRHVVDDFIYKLSFLKLNKQKKVRSNNFQELNSLSVLPDISVVMPVFNEEHYIYDSVKSILDQTFENFELIVMDDGSTDSTLQILSTFSDKRLKIIPTLKNLGIVEVLNSCIANSRAKYIARMDSDDIALPTRLQEQFEFLEQNPKVGLVGSWIELFGDIIQDTVCKYPQQHDDIVALMIFENPLAHPTVMFKRSLFTKCNYKYTTEFPFAEDWDLWTKCQTSTTIANLPKVLLRYRVHKSSSSKKFQSMQTDSKIKIFIKSIKSFGLSFDSRFFFQVPSSKNLVKTHYLLNTLYIKNSALKVVNNKSFDKVIDFLWFRYCSQLTEFGSAPAIFYFKNPIVEITFEKTFFRLLIILVKSNIRYLFFKFKFFWT